MSRNPIAIALLTVSALLTASGALVAQERPPRPEKYFVPFSAPQNFIDHARFFKEEVIKVDPYNIWSINTPNGGIGNVIVLEGDDGLVIIDTSVGVEHAKRARDLMRELTKKPVTAVIYTHHHADHTNGTTVFVSREDARSGKVKVIAAENFMQENERENSASGPIMALRAGYMYGVLLPPDAEGTHYHIGCCGFTVTGTGGFIAPNTFLPLDRPTEMTLAGYRFVFFHTGGEAASHIGIYLPEQRIVFTGDEIQGPTFPQLHSLRGTRPRNIEGWFQAIDRMRSYRAEYLVPGHVTVPSQTLFNMLRYRINPQRADGKHVTLGYRFTDTGEDFTLTLRNRVLQVEAERAADVDARVEMSRKQFNRLFDGKLSQEEVVAGGGRITGEQAAIKTLFAVMDQPEELPTPHISLR